MVSIVPEKQRHSPEEKILKIQLTHCTCTVHIKNIIQVSDKASMPSAAVFSREVIDNKTPQQLEDIFPLTVAQGFGLQ